MKKCVQKIHTGADISSCKMIIVTDITVLFSDLVSSIIPLQTWNIKYYKYAIIKNSLKSLLLVTIVLVNNAIPALVPAHRDFKSS